MTRTNLLCVDDEQNILTSLKRLLRGEAFNVLTADNAEDALKLLRENLVQVVMVDQRMPDVNGAKLLQLIKQERPDTVRLVLSGYADVATILESINKGEIYRFLSKPWVDEEIKITLRQSFEHYFLQNENAQLLNTIQEQNKQLESLNQQLENSLQKRTKLLRLMQELIQQIPLPVMGVDVNGQVVSANQQAMIAIDHKLNLGDNLEAILSHDLVDDIVLVANGESDARMLDSPFGKVQVIPFSVEQDARGSLLIMQGVVQ